MGAARSTFWAPDENKGANVCTHAELDRERRSCVCLCGLEWTKRSCAPAPEEGGIAHGRRTSNLRPIRDRQRHAHTC